MQIVGSLKESWREYRTELSALLKSTAPFLIGAIGLEVAEPYLLGNPTLLQSILYQCCITLCNAGVIFLGLKHLMAKRGYPIYITNNRIFVYILSTVYLTVAVSIGFLLLVLPGLMIMASAYLAPIYILKEKQGPIEAIASSTAAMRPILFKVLGLFIIFFVVIFALDYTMPSIVGGSAELVGSLILSIFFALVSIYNLCFMANIYDNLHEDHNNSSNPDAVIAGS